MRPITFDPIGGSWFLVAAALFVVAIVALTVAPGGAQTARWRRRVAQGIRLLALPIFAVLFSRPSVVVVETEELPATVAILCDLSESMTIEDGDASGRSRYDAMRGAFDDARDALRALCEKLDVRVFGFGDALEELPVEDGRVAFPEKATLPESRIGDALEDALRATAGKRMLSVALLSDGAQRAQDSEATTPRDAALRYRDADRPLAVATFGSADAGGAARDLAIADLRANDRVFVGNEFVVSGQLRATGFAGREIPVTFEFETEPGVMTVVETTTLTPKSDDATVPWRFAYKPTREGEWKLRVSAPIQPKELLEANNELSAFVEAVDGGAKILYIEGTRRYEQNFIRAALNASSDALVRYWRPPVSSLVGKFPDKTEAELVATLASSRKSLVSPFFTKGKYSVYVIGDADSDAFQEEELKALAQLVEDGAGLIALAGERSLSLGGYAKTPLADVLPVETSVGERLPLDMDLAGYEAGEPNSERTRIEGDFVVEPTEGAMESRDAFAIDLNVDAKKNLELWKSMPPLADVYRLGRVKRNATTLLTARPVGAKGGAGYPLLVTHQYGLGRVAVLATDSTWRWRMRGKSEEHAKFWRQLALWAAKTDETLEGELAIIPDSSRLAPGDEAAFSVVYRPKEGESLDRIDAEAAIVAPDGSRVPVALTRDGGVWRSAETTVSALGDYLIEASLVSETGETLQSTRSRFLVYEKNFELERPGASPDVMENLAATTQGKVVAPGEFKSYLEELLKERTTIVDTRETMRTLYDSWQILLAFATLMTADWILRRRWGMP